MNDLTWFTVCGYLIVMENIDKKDIPDTVEEMFKKFPAEMDRLMNIMVEQENKR